MYEIEFTNRAVKNLKKIDSKYQKLIIEKLEVLAQNPAKGVNIKPLIGTIYYRLRVADYRVIYELQNNELIILVIDINHRKDIY
jgi:mRNA interferase RelE/StbE